MLNGSTHTTKEGHPNERSSLAQLSDTTKAKTRGQNIALDLRRTIQQFFPDLFTKLEAVSDPRSRRDYTITEILLGGLFMFICKQGSRNAMNLDRSEPLFAQNFEKLFGKRLPHMDTVNEVLVNINDNELEELKAVLVASLIAKKVFSKFRLGNRSYRIAVDATGVMSVSEGHCDHCLTRTSKNGVVSYFHNILEAKLVTPNGFSISLASEWIENKGDYDKQDCELKAFKRLSWKLKKYFPRLPICILADGLYPNKTFFDICSDHSWDFIATFKDGNLKTLWEDIDMDLLTSKDKLRIEHKRITQNYRWLCGLSYQGHKLSWAECIEEGEKIMGGRFVFVTNLEIDKDQVAEICESGRMRFKIENEGFNALKNLGYGLEHKFSRKSNGGMKNYVSLMHIAQLFNQLYELSSLARPLLTGKTTVRYLWKRMLSALLEIPFITFEGFIKQTGRFQIRYE